MGIRDERGTRGFHEAPLVLFTALAAAGGGLAGAHLLLSLLTWLPWVPQRGVMTVIALFLIVGLLFSAGHLGRPLRGPLALRRVGKSPLSNEALVAGGAAILTVVAALVPMGHALAAPLSLLALALVFLTVFALGAVYRLEGQLTWGGPAMLQPAVLGVAFGLMLFLETLPPGARARAEILILMILLADGFLVIRRAGIINKALARGEPIHLEIMNSRGVGFILRILFGVLLPAWCLLNAQLGLAVSFLLVTLFLDRFLFYGLAVKASTEAEVQRVERFLSKLSP